MICPVCAIPFENITTANRAGMGAFMAVASHLKSQHGFMISMDEWSTVHDQERFNRVVFDNAMKQLEKNVPIKNMANEKGFVYFPRTGKKMDCVIHAAMNTITLPPGNRTSASVYAVDTPVMLLNEQCEPLMAVRLNPFPGQSTGPVFVRYTREDGLWEMCAVATFGEQR